MEKYQFPKIKDEIQFENFTRDLLNLLHQDNSFQLYGRKGQAQYGLDGYSTIHPIFFQCKHKSSPHVKDSKLEEELENELNKAKSKIEEVSNSKESKFLFFTTHPNSTTLQDKARILSTDSIIVEYWGWDTIESHLNNLYISKNREFFIKYYPEFAKALMVSKIPSQLTTTLGKSTIIGREKELQEIDTKLKSSKTLLVKGIGGIGKSTIASNYLHLHKDEFEYYGFFEGLDSFESQLEIFFDLKIEQGQDRLDRVLRELIKLEPESKKLLIIDNVQDIKENQVKLEKILGLEHNGYSILLTSREEIENIERYDLDVLFMDDAKKLFKSIYDDVDDDTLLEEVLGYLDRHTFFIKITAQSLAYYQGELTIEKLKYKFVNGELPKIDKEYKKNFNYFLEKLFSSIQTLDVDEILLLKQLSILPSIDIDFIFLKQIFSNKNNIKFKGILNFLSKKGWLIKTENSYKLHQIIKEYILENHQTSFEEIEGMVEFFTIHEKQHIIWKNCLESISTFLIKKEFKNKEISELYWYTGFFFYYSLGDYLNAKKYFTLSENIIKNDSYSLKFLAFCSDKLEETEEAYSYITQALELFEKENNNEQIAICYDTLGSIYWQKQEFNISLDYYFNALKFYEEKEKESSQIAKIYNNISLVYRDNNDLINAFNYIEKAFESNSDDVLMIAQFYNNRGEFHTDKENYELAEQDIQKALEIREEVIFYENHDNFAESYDNLAIIYHKTKRYKEAYDYQCEAIKILELIRSPYLVEAKERLSVIENELHNE